ncbi:anthrax toxin lethal factor-related metalloendopeptidase [Planctomycetes bacterium K23_9]
MAALSILCFANHLEAQTPQRFADPIQRNIEGWTVFISPEVVAQPHRSTGEECLSALANHLQRVRWIVSPERLAELQQVGIWVHWDHTLENLQYHPSRGWLLANDHDPRLAKHVHVGRAKNLIDRRQWTKHPYAILHELAHAYHDQKLGFDYPPVRSAYEKMKQSGTYDKVLSHKAKHVKHYALNNHKEYFAESTEAYFGVNDFFPFVRAELKEHDPDMHQLMETIWGKIP